MVVNFDPGSDLLLTSNVIWILEPTYTGWVVKQRQSTAVDNIIMEKSSEKKKNLTTNLLLQLSWFHTNKILECD